MNPINKCFQLILSKIRYFNNSECCICLMPNTLKDDLTFLKCGHVFHSECIERWENIGKGNCPYCQR